MSSKAILITGVNGFVGTHLVNEILDQGFEVIGLGREEEPNNFVRDKLKAYLSCDLLDKISCSEIPLENITAIINLAGIATVGPSFENPELYMSVNVGSLTGLFEAIKRQAAKHIRVIAVSTGAVYASNQGQPLDENSKTNGESSPYVASKLAMEAAALSFIKEGYDCVIARPFNHIGPGQVNGFLLADLYEKISSAGDEIKVGNLKTSRDYTDVRDVAKAYTLLATQNSLKFNTYNICSGKPVSGEQLLEIVLRLLGKENLKVVVDETLFRPSDSPILYGNASKLKEDTGWEPGISLGQTIKDFINFRR